MVKHFLKLENFIQYIEEHHSKSAPIYYMILSSFLQAFSAFLSKKINRVPTEQLVFIRAIVMFTVNSAFLSAQKLEVYKSDRCLTMKLILRSVLGSIQTLLFFSALKYLTISEGIVLFRTSPLWTTMVAIAYLKKETLTLSLMVNIVVCLVGITLIAQPPFLTEIIYGVITIPPEYHFLGIGLMILASLCSSSVQILLNSMASQIHQIVLMQYFSFISMMVPAAALFIQPQQLIIPNQTETYILIIIGIASYFCQLLMNRAYMKGNLSKVSMTGQTQVLFTYVFDLLIGQEINLLSTFGGILIIGTLVSIIFQKQRNQSSLPR